MKKSILGVGIICGALALTACGASTKTVHVVQTVTAVPSSAPTVTKTKIITHTHTRVVQAPPVVVDPGNSYTADIHAAGISAPDGWIINTGNTLCSMWAQGEGPMQTDPLLLAGGIYTNHLGTFDAITREDVCP